MAIKDDRLIFTVGSSYPRSKKTKIRPLDQKLFCKNTVSTYCEPEFRIASWSARMRLLRIFEAITVTLLIGLTQICENRPFIGLLTLGRPLLFSVILFQVSSHLKCLCFNLVPVFRPITTDGADLLRNLLASAEAMPTGIGRNTGTRSKHKLFTCTSIPIKFLY